MLSAVLGKKGIDFSEAAGFVTVFRGPRLPFVQLCGQELAALADALENGFAAGFGSGRPVESLFGSLAIVTPGESPVTAESCERFLGSLSVATGSSEVGDGALLVSLKSCHGVEGSVGGPADDGCQLEPFAPQRVDRAGGGATG